MVRVAILGAGRWGPNLLRCFQALPGCQVTRVVDLLPQRLEAVAARAPGATLSTVPGDVFSDPGVDAVAIATPTATHAALAAAALRAGKHVLVEKPLAAGLEDARGLEALAREAGRVLLVGHVYRFNEAARRFGQLLEQGAAGTLHSLLLERTHLGPVRTDADVVLDLASHDVSLALAWLGRPPEAVRAVGGAWLDPALADEVHATLRYPRGPLVQLHASWLWPRRARRATAIGSRGMLVLDDLDPAAPLTLTAHGQPGDSGAAPAEVQPGLPGPEPLLAEVRHFLDCVVHGTPPLTGARHGVEVAAVLEALQRSLALGGAEVAVPPQPVRSP